jgi:hypothetical protein
MGPNGLAVHHAMLFAKGRSKTVRALTFATIVVRLKARPFDFVHSTPESCFELLSVNCVVVKLSD